MPEMESNDMATPMRRNVRNGEIPAQKVAGFSRTTRRILFSYSFLSFLNRLYASAWAGDSGLGLFRSSWMPRRICLTVIAGFHASSSFRMERQTVPEG